MLQLRDYQQEFVDGLRGSFSSGSKATLGVLPTGGGKTVCFTHIADNASRRGNDVMILVHRIELLRQTSAALDKFGCYHGRINPRYTPDYSAKIQVGSVQTVINRLGYINAPRLIIIDEAHHATASTWRKIFSAFPNATKLGVTATPIRGDGIGLGAQCGGVFEDLVIGPQINDLIERGYLVRPKLYRSPEAIDFTGIRTRMGDFDRGQMAKLMNSKDITGDAADHYRDLLRGDPAVVFCCNVDHAKAVAAQFRDMGFRSEAVYGKRPAKRGQPKDEMTDEKRDQILTGLGDGSINVVTSCDLISEGTDIPVIRGGIMLRKTKSLGLYIQQAGRILRTAPGKEDAILIDHVHNSLLHGGVHWERDWTLDGETKKDRKKREEDAEKMAQCEKCFACYDPAPACPYCGHVGKPRVEPPKVKAGKLKLVSDEEDRFHQKLTKGELTQAINNAKGLDEWHEIALRQGYNPLWVIQKMKATGEEVGRKELKELAERSGYKSGWVFHTAKRLKIKL